MTRLDQYFRRPMKRFSVREDGTTLVEFAVCIALFLLILFAILDFGRLGYNWVVTEKAMQRGVRMAAVRYPICPGVPTYHRAPAGVTSGVTAGMLCRSGPNICDSSAITPCLLSSAATSTDARVVSSYNDIYGAIQNLLPTNADDSNILVRYDYDAQLGFLGGPFVPKITVQLVGDPDGAGGFNELQFTFVTPLTQLAATAGAANSNSIPGSIPFPAISVTLPAEDLNIGVNG